MSTTTLTPAAVAERLGLDRSTRRLARLRRWLAAGLVAAAALAAAASVWNRRQGTEAVHYVTQPVARGDLRVTVTATGSLAPIKQVQVGSELSGIVRRVTVDHDQRVTAGQVLAQLDTTKLEAQIAQAEGALGAARARVAQAEVAEEEARSALGRAEHLAATGLVSQADLDSARAAHQRTLAEHASAAAAAAQAEAALAAIRADLAKTTIRSPISGVVLVRAVQPGQTVAASFQAPVLFTLAEDLTRMELDVGVDEADVAQVKPGQEATFTVDAYPDHPFPTRVAAVRLASQASEGVVSYTAILYVDNADLLLRPGMTATAEIVVRHARDVVLVPNAALRFVPPDVGAPPPQPSGGGLWGRLLPRPPRRPAAPPEPARGDGRHQRVWVLRDGRPAALAITVGATDGQSTEVTSGNLEPGTAVIVEARRPGVGS